MRTRLGCITLPGLLTVLFALLVLGGINLLRGGVLYSPGRLAAQQGGQALGGVFSHAELKTKCAACHPAPWENETMSDRCLACHVEVREDPGNFHQKISTAVESCRNCHRDHRGADASITVMDFAEFPHEKLGYSLTAHQKTAFGAVFACGDCHGERVSKFDLDICLSCHRMINSAYMEKHTAVFGNGCLSCHDGVDAYGEFNHNQVIFPLIGKHGEVECLECHAGAKTPGELQATSVDCYACHAADDPHLRRMGTACAACHTPEGWRQSSFDHLVLRFPLTGKHTSVPCLSCHLDDTPQDTPQDCYSCHANADDHNGQLGSDCAACHTPDGWDKATFDHSLSAFPLTGKHTEVSCALCHPGGQYAGTPITCYGCHAQDDPHNTEYGTGCDLCHSPDGWIPANFTHTRFPLTGAHRNLLCTSCHQGGNFTGTPADCVGCHEDPPYHVGLFGNSCHQCHNTTAWRPAEYRRGHTFPQGHGEANNICQTCHPATLSQYTCYSCHDAAEIREEHIKEEITNYENCMRCHPTGEEGDDLAAGAGRVYTALFSWLKKLWSFKQEMNIYH